MHKQRVRALRGWRTCAELCGSLSAVGFVWRAHKVFAPGGGESARLLPSDFCSRETPLPNMRETFKTSSPEPMSMIFRISVAYIDRIRVLGECMIWFLIRARSSLL